MEKAMKRDKIEVNDRQLACAHINSPEGQDYLKSMAAAANFAWVNRSCMTFCARQVFFWKTMKIAWFYPKNWILGENEEILAIFTRKWPPERDFLKTRLNMMFHIKNLSGICQSVQNLPRRPRYAVDLRCFTQHCQIWRTYGWWAAKNVVYAPKRFHPGLSAPSPVDSGGLSGFLHKNMEFSIIAYIMHLKHQFWVDRTTGSDRRHHGHM